jgi:hypothetical protein
VNMTPRLDQFKLVLDIIHISEEIQKVLEESAPGRYVKECLNITLQRKGQCATYIVRSVKRTSR